MKVLDPIEPTQDDQEFAAQAVRQFSSGAQVRLESERTPLVRPRGRAAEPAIIANVAAERFVVIPARIAALFQQILVQVASGKAVTIVPYDRMLSTQDAADLLNVSRPFLVKLLEQEHVPIQKVGNRRRIAFPEVVKLKEKFRRQSDEAFKELAAIDNEIGID
jgi:excisionase family DNA binding protein